MSENLFRKESLDRVRSPERTDSYLKVSNPSGWLLIAAAALLVVSFAVWGFLGQIPVSIAAAGVVKNGEVAVILPAKDAPSIEPSMEVLINGNAHAISSISDIVVSAEELKTLFGDQDYYKIKPAEQNLMVTADAQGVEDGVVAVSVVVATEHPITYLVSM